MLSRRHISSMKKKEKHKQHEQTGEELFPRLIQQSRKSVVPRPGNLGSGSVSGSSSSRSGRGLHSAHRVRMRCLGKRAKDAAGLGAHQLVHYCGFGQQCAPGLEAGRGWGCEELGA